MANLKSVGLILLAGSTWILAGSLAEEPVGFSEELGERLPGLTAKEDAEFVRGRRLFRIIWGRDQRFFNAITCVACHFEPEIGGTVDDPELLVNFVPDPASASGWAPYPKVEIQPGGRAVDRPRPANAESRKTPALFGLGLLEAVPESGLDAIADPDDRNKDGISGRSIRVDGKIGRFGWKAAVTSIDDFVVDAFRHELGLGLRDGEFLDFTRIGRTQISMTSQYIRMLSPPRPPKLDPEGLEGRKLFERIGCAKCHVTRLVSGPSEIASVNKKSFEPYTDLLLHDVGPGPEQRASSGAPTVREYRTPPLWGLGGAGAPFWHDASVKTLDGAIRKHEGEATKVRDAYSKLPERERLRLLGFVENL